MYISQDVSLTTLTPSKVTLLSFTSATLTVVCLTEWALDVATAAGDLTSSSSSLSLSSSDEEREKEVNRGSSPSNR